MNNFIFEAVQKKKLLSRIIKGLVYSIGSILLLSILLLRTNDTTSLSDSSYYIESKTIIKNILPRKLDSTYVKVGWSKSNITPDFQAKVVGFGKNGYYDEVLDSLYVSSIVFEQSNRKYLYLSYDLMIVHPLMVEYLESRLKQENIHFDGIYYSATHTHNGIGSYADKIAGFFALGGRDEKILEFLTNKAFESIVKASAKASPAEYQYIRKTLPKLVNNRLDKQHGTVDSTIRILYVRNESKEVMSLITFAAHPTCLPRNLYKVSADYPGEIVKNIEKSDDVDFAVFSAGAVGSHETPLIDFTVGEKNFYSKNITDKLEGVLIDTNFKPLIDIQFQNIELPLRSPHFKVGKYLRLRPWVFKWAFGEGKGKLSFLKLGDICFIGTPCDFSGELLLEIEKEICDSKLQPVITSFNGQYLGYITPDKYYHWDTHEVRDANWFGPYNGRYFKESIVEVLRKME